MLLITMKILLLAFGLLFLFCPRLVVGINISTQKKTIHFLEEKGTWVLRIIGLLIFMIILYNSLK